MYIKKYMCMYVGERICTYMHGWFITLTNTGPYIHTYINKHPQLLTCICNDDITHKHIITYTCIYKDDNINNKLQLSLRTETSLILS